MTSTGPIEVVAFEAANSRAYLRSVFAAWAQGHCVMALPEGAGARKVPGTAVLKRESFAPDPGWFEAGLPVSDPDTRALIAFSSGTTGRPKAILLRHRALQDVVGRINAAMGVDDTIREYLGVPVTYSFGFGRARAVATAGGRAFLPEHGFDPSEINRMLGAEEINAVSAVPTLWRILLANKGSISAESAQKLRWIEIGSQWMTGAEKLDLRRLFPNAKIIQHYGLTEASRTTLLDISEAPEDRLDSVGRALGDVDIKIDADGRIQTRGPHLAEGLVSGAGVKAVADASGWMTTSDRGQIEDGWLSYQGRVDELINSGGLKIDPTAFEQAINASLGVPGAVAAGRLEDTLRGEKVLVALKSDAGLDRDSVTQTVAAEAERLGLVGNGSFELREVAVIPMTETGKVKRAELAGLDDIGQAGATATAPSAATDTGSKATDLQALWAEILGAETVPTDKSFYDLGGDSLSALTAIVKMESLGIEADSARGIFEGKTIAEMAGEEAPASAVVSHIPASSGKTAELQALWAEILTLETVPTDKSFYDLGGDSLSALTAIMKMQSLGIEADSARGIFEGKTIADMAGEAAPAAPQPAAGKAGELQALWAEILGLEAVPTNKSFYDLGGDSLSALTAIMKMQSLGIEAETARGIFEGKTIADMAGEAAPVAPQAPVQPAAPVGPTSAEPAHVTGPVLSLAETVNSVHAARGVLVLWVVVVHWLPAFLGRLGENTVWIYEAMLPALRFGTPGFAMVFGMGVGALGLYHYQSNPEMFRKSTRFNTKLIVGGVLLLGLGKVLIALAEGNLGDKSVQSGLLYSAITYYALAMLTLPLIVRLLVIGPNRLLTILALGAGSMLIHEGLVAAFADAQPNAVLEFIKITFTAKYGYFRMTGFVMVGLAIGWLFRRHHAQSGVIRDMATYGGVLIALGLVGIIHAQSATLRSDFNFVYLWHLAIYAGAALLILSGFARINRAGGTKTQPVKWLNSFAIASGILALPIFVGHELIWALKQLSDALGVPDTIGLVVVLGLFFAGLFVGYRRLMKFL